MPNQFTVSLWGDEGFSAILSMKSVSEIISIIIRDTSPPLYNLSEHFWFLLFGTSEVAIRSLSFVYYLIAVFFAFKIASLFWNKKTAIISTALVFLNPFFFTYAFEGRMYSILAAMVVGSFYFFLKKNWVGYVIFATLALYSHHFAIFALFFQGLWFVKEVLAKNKKLVKPMFFSFLAIGFLYSPWIYPLYTQTKMVGGGFWLGTPSFNDLKELIYKYLATGIQSPFSKVALWFVLAGLAVRVWTKDLGKSFFLLLWFLVPILTVFLISQKFQSIFFDRYMLFSIPPAMILLGSNLRGKISGALILCVIFLFLVIDVNYFFNPTKRPFREFSEVVKQELRGDDFLINWNSASHHLWETKYYGIGAPIYVPEGGSLPFFVGTALMDESDIIREIPDRLPDKTKVNRVGAVTSGSPEEVQIPGFVFLSYNEVGPLKIVWLSRR